MDNWEILYAEHGNHFVFFVYSIEKKYLFNFLRTPHLTPYSGLLFSSNNLDFSIQQILVNNLLQNLPSFDEINLDLHPTISTDLKFDKIFTSTKITNILPLNDISNIENRYRPSLKRQIKKATKNIIIQSSNDISLFYELHKKTFLKQNSLPKVPFEFFHKVWSLCERHNCGKLFFASDKEGNLHAALLLVYDNETAYYLSGGTDANFYGSGAMSLLMHHAIIYATENDKLFFDFEGSMIPSVNRFFKNYNPIEVKYLNLHKENSFVLRSLKKLNSIS